MSKLMYVLDTSIFITAANGCFSFDFGEKFWSFLLKNAQDGILCSIDKVLAEIEQGEDYLKDWVTENLRGYFYPTNDDEILKHFAEISGYVSSLSSHYKQEAIDDFLQEDNADPWVIAFAKAKRLTVVTQEKPNPNSKRKVKIPDVCKRFNIRCIDMITMLKELKFKI